MKKKVMALCDSESEYAEGLSYFLKKKEDFPYEIHTYTDVDILLEQERKEPSELLLVAESDYTYEVAALPVKRTVLLNESGSLVENVRNIDKYQKADCIYRELAAEIAENLSREDALWVKKLPASVIGLYSPVKRCLQTSFALTLGEVLSEKKKVLYISFEHYAGWNQLLERSVKGDLPALLYFLEESDEKFAAYLHSFTMQIGKLHYIPPAYAGQNLIYVKALQWQELLSKIARLGGYDYLILDLSESIQGIFDLLKMCDRIYTLSKEDEKAKGKIEQYEDLLREYRLEEILEKTDKRLLPEFSRMPQRIEQYTRGEFAEYIRQIAEEVLEDTYA